MWTTTALKSQKFGATRVLNNSDGKTVENVMDDKQKGVDAAIEAVRIPATFDICQEIIGAMGISPISGSMEKR
jgi:alcohol dehydrogenase